jgi:hypothetical protein
MHESNSLDSFDTYQRSTFLFPDSGFLHGAARLVDFRRRLNEYNVTPTESGADTRALIQDWLAVGDDLRRAFAETHIES